MAYLIDRHRAWRMAELVAIVRERARQGRSRILLRDGSLCISSTRPRTLLRWAQSGQALMRGWGGDALPLTEREKR